MAGRWRCPGQQSKPPSFQGVRLLEVAAGSRNLDVKQHLREAQRSGQPVLLRRGRPERNVSDLAGHVRIPVFADDLKRFDMHEFDWSGLKQGKQSDLVEVASGLASAKMLVMRHNQNDSSAEEDLLPYLTSLKEPGDKPVMMVNLSDVVASTHSNASRGHSYFLHLHDDVRAHHELVQAMSKGNITTGSWPKGRGESSFWPLEPAAGVYPLFEGDRLDYELLLVQPPGLGGAHIDDLEGATYFFLRVLEGHKTVRLWPNYEQGQVLDWGCAMYTWMDRLQASPELFLRGKYSQGFASDHWTDRGFEYSILNWQANEYYDFNRSCAETAQNRDPLAGLCFVEVELGPGDELFVPSGIPHQVTTNEASVAVSANFRFSPVGSFTVKTVERLLEAADMSTDVLDDDDTDFEFEDIHRVLLQHPDFDMKRWRKLRKHFEPQGWLSAIGRNSSERYSLITAVLASLWQQSGEVLHTDMSWEIPGHFSTPRLQTDHRPVVPTRERWQNDLD